MQSLYEPIWGIYGDSIPLRPEYPEIGEGSRNMCLASLAGQLKSADWSAEDIAKEIRMVNREKCKPPLPEDEVRQILRSINRYRR